jgi:hypothetical protein
MSMVLARGSWQPGWDVTYCLEITERDPGSSKVISACCKLCKYFGREEGDTASRKRARTQKLQHYSAPFRPANFVTHNKSQHEAHWQRYSEASAVERKSFFEDTISRANTLHAHLDLDGDVIKYRMASKTVEVVVGELMFRPEDEILAAELDGNDVDDLNEAALVLKVAKLKRNAMKLFSEQEDGSYSVTIKNALRFRLAIDHVSSGLSFRQTAKVIDQTHRHTKIAKLAGLSDYMVDQFVRVLVGASIQKIADVMARSDVWAFSIAFDGSTHRGTSFFDVRVRIGVNCLLYNLHLVALPMFDRHTADNQVAMLVTLLDAVLPEWRDKLLGVSTDGERTNTGHINGVVTQLDAMATFNVCSFLIHSL